MALIDLSGLSNVAIKLLEMLEKTIGWIATPSGSGKDRVEGLEHYKQAVKNDSTLDEITKAVMIGRATKDFREHMNQAKVVEKALPDISELANPDDVDEDWFSFFFDKVRLVSDDTVQEMWGQILANELNAPGSFQRSLLHALSIMNYRHATLFCNLARFCMNDFVNKGMVQPFIYIKANASAYRASRIEQSQLETLENLGLISCNFTDDFVLFGERTYRYGSRIINIYGNPNNDDKIKVGNVRLTNDGLALYGIVGSEYKQFNIDILDFTITKLKRRSCRVEVDGKEVK